jgi:hypothetical protein
MRIVQTKTGKLLMNDEGRLQIGRLASAGGGFGARASLESPRQVKAVCQQADEADCGVLQDVFGSVL